MLDKLLPRWLRPGDHRTDADAAQALRFRMPEETLLARRLELLGLHPVKGIRVTDNRTVMVSLSPKGVLRIHRGYARAPDRILKAVVRFVAPRTPRALRRAAEGEILSFRPEDHAAGPPRRRRAGDRALPGDAEKIERLAQLFGEYNGRFFGGELPALPIRLSGRMRTRLGQLCLQHETGEPYEITLSRAHVDRHGWAEASHTLLHEMIHLWQHGTATPWITGPPSAARRSRWGSPGRRAARCARRRVASAPSASIDRPHPGNPWLRASRAWISTTSDRCSPRRSARSATRSAQWVDDQLLPVIDQHYVEGRFPLQLVPQMAELGFFGANLPEEYGCAGLNNVAYGLIMQELERGDSGVRSFASVQGALVMYPIYAFGSEEQKQDAGSRRWRRAR